MWLYAALILFLVAAFGGVMMLMARVANRRWPKVLTIGHGLVAVLAIGLLCVPVLRGDQSWHVTVAIALFALAATGGFTLFFGFDRRSRRLPIPVILVHGLVAISAIVLLILGSL